LECPQCYVPGFEVGFERFGLGRGLARLPAGRAVLGEVCLLDLLGKPSDFLDELPFVLPAFLELDEQGLGFDEIFVGLGEPLSVIALP